MRRRNFIAGAGALGARLALPGAVVGISGCSGLGFGPAVSHLSGSTMGTTFRVSVADGLSAPELETLRAAHAAILARIDARMSTWKASSELSRVNAAPAGAWVPVSDETRRVVAAALDAGGRSAGAFDPTVGPLVDLWGFGPSGGGGVLPADAVLADTASAVGSGNIELDAAAPRVRKANGATHLDLGGIAKGWAVDALARDLDARGIDRYLVEVGGELRARGRKPAGDAWRVGIERPDPADRAALAIVALEDAAIATSGDYRNFWSHGGRTYSHAIDPRTAHPVAHGLAAVSVIAGDTMSADALSTAMLVMGLEDGRALAEREGVGASFIVREHGRLTEHATPAFDALRIA